jgi:predicted transcriptional regulator
MRPLVPETELRILIALFRLGDATSPELSAYLTSEDAPLSANTVKGLLHRLLKRGYVRTDKRHSSRVWSVNPEKINEVLKAEAKYVVRFRHDGDPRMLNLLLKEIHAVLKPKNRPKKSA